jgi:glycosyltransferase involved in cell wall biosynthesis
MKRGQLRRAIALPISFVKEAFRNADIALIPSWYEYAEGVPGTIYEAFAARTPVICTDHPGFKDVVGKGGAAILVPEKSPRKIADAIKRVMTDPNTYESMSIATRNAWELLCCPLRREELMEYWLANSTEADAFLAKFSLASGIYD